MSQTGQRMALDETDTAWALLKGKGLKMGQLIADSRGFYRPHTTHSDISGVRVRPVEVEVGNWEPRSPTPLPLLLPLPYNMKHVDIGIYSIHAGLLYTRRYIDTGHKNTHGFRIVYLGSWVHGGGGGGTRKF